MEPLNWQTQLSTIRERNEYAFNKSLFCDVEFSVQDSNGDKVIIPANKYVLAVSSPVFEAMFYGELAESKPTIDLPDCTKEGLHELLRYVYSDEVNLTGSNVMEVLYLAEKYMMPFLVEKCKNYLQDEVGPEDVLSVLPQVQKIGDEELQKHLWDIVDSETHQTVSSGSFLPNVSREMLCQILERETLKINEVDLFRAVDRWAGERIKEKGLDSNGKTKRSILGDEVIRLIRFPVMTQKEFAEVVLPCKILNMDEVTELVQSFNNISPATNSFSNKKRSMDCVVDGPLLIPRVRFDTIKGAKAWRWGYNTSCFGIDTINFTTNKSVDLVGVRMFGSNGSAYEVKLNIYKGDKVISQLSSSFLTGSEKIDGLYYGFTVNLDKPVRLDPGVVYTVEAQIDGPYSYYGEAGNQTITVEDVTITYRNSTKSVKTTCDRGQFPTLVFRKV